MNILLIAHERNLGGASKSLVTLAIDLQRRGNTVIVVVPFKSGQMYNELVKKKIPVRRIFFGWWMMPNYWNKFLKLAFRLMYMFELVPAARIAQLARKEKSQIIHSNSSVIDVGAIAAKMTGIPHIWHFREFGDIDYRLEYLRGADKSYRFISSIKGKVIFISKSLQEYYKNKIPDNLCEIIYNGISNDFLIEKKYNKEYTKIIFLISGNFHRNKGQSIALKAAKILKDKGIEDFELWLAGQIAATSDSHQYEKELQLYAEDNLGNICKFLGFISNMKELRQRTDVELVCSKGEAFGRVTIEAMMAGNPVIGANTGATPELITDKETGRLFHGGSAKDLAEKMLWFIERPRNIEDCGRKAYQYARDNFLASRNTEDIEKLYWEMIKGDISIQNNEVKSEEKFEEGVAQKVNMWNNLAEQSRAEQSRAEQSRAEQSRAEQSRA